jgi:uncharacterized protein YbjT (DUF2867 family)
VILLTGATGYIGSHLLGRLRSEGRRVRALSRTPERLEDRIDATVEAVQGDLDDPASLAAALEGVEAAYYLAHSLGTDADFAERERRAAVNFAEASAAAGVGRIVYLGGLGGADDELSPHLAARHEVGQILRESPVPTVELRASIVIGPGSASYDLLQLIVENVPVAVVPGWTRTLAQPIHVDDVVSYRPDAGVRRGAWPRPDDRAGAGVRAARRRPRAGPDRGSGTRAGDALASPARVDEERHGRPRRRGAT